MQVSTYAKALVAAFSIAALAGCSSNSTVPDNGAGANGANAGMTNSNGASANGLDNGNGVSGQDMSAAGSQMPTTSTVYFDFDRDTIRPEFESVLNDHAAYLRAHNSSHVTLQGHTDARGTREYNLGLGERRANAVRQYLAVQGVNAGQIEVVSYGQERPVCGERTEHCYGQNRRVEFAY